MNSNYFKKTFLPETITAAPNFIIRQFRFNDCKILVA